MVHIPTTERQHYNTTKKLNTLGAYARELAGAADDYRKELVRQQQIKVNTESTKMRVESDKFVQEWRLANQANPDNEDAKAQLQSGLQEIYGRYGNNIDPIAKMDWDVTVNKINSAYEIANNQWAINQRAENTKLDVADGMNANFELARSYGRSGNLAGALADYANSYAQLNSYAAQNMGATEARKLLDNYDEEFLTSYLNGLAEVDANAAMQTMKQPEVAKVFAGKDSEEMMTKIINKQIAKQNFDLKFSQFKNEQILSDKLDSMDTLDALKLLENNKSSVSSAYFDIKKKSLMSASGIDAETQDETSTEILLDITMLPKDQGASVYFDAVNKLLVKIEDKYSKGLLGISDKKKFIKELYKGQEKNIGVLKEDTSDDKWLSWGDYTYKDAWNYIDSKYIGTDKNQVLLEYFRTVNGQDMNKKDKIAALNSIINYANAGDLQLPRFANEQEARDAYAQGKIKKGDTIYINGVRGKL